MKKSLCLKKKHNNYNKGRRHNYSCSTNSTETSSSSSSSSSSSKSTESHNHYGCHNYHNSCSSSSSGSCSCSCSSSSSSSCSSSTESHGHHKYNNHHGSWNNHHGSCNNQHGSCNNQHGSCNCHKYNAPSCDPCANLCDQVEIKACKLPIGALKVEKTILNAGFIADGSSISAPDFSVTFEIVLTNCTCHQICDLSIIDSLMGLKGQPFNGDDDNNYGGELRPYFTNVDIIGCDNCLVPLRFDKIIKRCGELLDTCRSFIEPCSIARLMVRITGRGFLNPVTPSENEQTSVEKYKWTTLMQNTAVVKGNILVDHCQKVPIFPIYIKSGIVKGWNAELNTDLPNNT